MRMIRLIIAMTCALFLQACGQKGELYLPGYHTGTQVVL